MSECCSKAPFCEHYKEKLNQTKVKIVLRLDEAQELLSLLGESSNTGNREWDKRMKSIEQKIKEKI